MNIETKVEEIKTTFPEIVRKVSDNWNDYYRGVSDGQNIFEMSLMETDLWNLDDEELYGEDDILPQGCAEWEVLYFELFDIYKKEI